MVIYLLTITHVIVSIECVTAITRTVVATNGIVTQLLTSSIISNTFIDIYKENTDTK